MGSEVLITGTARDFGGGSVAKVEVSLDGGAIWNPASGTDSWSYLWTVPYTSGSSGFLLTINSRATDNSGNQQNPPSQTQVVVVDRTPPTVTSFSPADGADNVSLFANVNVTFSEIMDARTVNGSTVELLNPSGALTPATVSLDPFLQTAILAPTAPLAGGVTYTAIVKGGDAGVKDTARNPLAADLRWSFTTGTPPTITSFSPADGADNVSLNANVVVTFNEAMDARTVNRSTVLLIGPSGNLVFATVSLDPFLQIATLAPTEPLVGGFTYTAIVKGGDAGVKDLAGNPLTTDMTWTFRTVPSPRVLSVTPEQGATNTSPKVWPVATFSEALDPATLNVFTVQMTDATANALPIQIVYAPSVFRVLVMPNAVLQYGRTYTVTLRGGAVGNRITNLAGVPLEADFTWSFTLAPPPPPIPTWSIWAPNEGPDSQITNELSPRELGLKFRSDRSGIITGIRVYGAGAVNLQPYTGHLWTSSGTLLGSFDFFEQNQRGWQQSFFGIPIPIEANTTYVVSYSVPQRNSYLATPGYFESQGRDNGPLHAPKGADVGGNGVIGPIGEFPDQPSMFTNFWVDAVFGDTEGMAPQVLEAPQANTTVASTDLRPQTRFSKRLDPASVNESTVMLIDQANNLVPANVSYDANTLTVTITPDRLLHLAEFYTVVLKGGAAAPHITDLEGLPLAYDYTWTFFTVGPSPDPKPILLLTSITSGNKFAQYYGEILRAEGFSFTSCDIAEAGDSTLSQHKVIILGETQLIPADITRLSNWVAAGGNLIAMRPDKQLAPLLGISDAAAVQSEAYLQIDTSRQPGEGIVGETIQYHGTADLYTIEGDTQQVATLYSSPTEATPNPAVTLRSVGTNGGQVAAFTFDLARSIIYTRQGNPAWAGQDRDGNSTIRTNDLFFGGAEPNWINLDKVAIPQADELQRLFANLILSMSADTSPLPRFWYLPNMKKAAIMMTGDDHGAPNGTQTVFDMLNAASPPDCASDNWECYRATSWVSPESGLTNDQARNYANQGFQVGAYITTNCENWTPESLSASVIASRTAFREKYVDVEDTYSNRIQCGVWTDWATYPKAGLDYSITLDASYYYWPPQWVLGPARFMTGSGFPMRYADLDGSIINVYQAATHLSRETGASPDSINSLLDKAIGPEGYYGVFGVGYDYTDQFAATILDIARARNVSLISAEQLRLWLGARGLSSFSGQVVKHTDSGFELRFSINVFSRNLNAMIPYEALGGRVTSIVSNTVQKSPIQFTIETIKGRSYAVFLAREGLLGIIATYTSNP